MSVDASIDIIAVRALQKDVGRVALERLVGIFAEECDRNCREISAFLSKNDLPGSEIVAHRFKSTARQFGANGLADTCQQLEGACADGHGDTARELFDALELLAPRVLDNLADAMSSAIEDS